MNNDFLEFESIKKFNLECTNEIGKLIKFSIDNQEDIQLFISSAVVLLGSKFENCVENIIKEYIDKINNKADKNKIPDKLKYSCIHNELYKYKDHINTSRFNCLGEKKTFLEDFSKFVVNVMNNLQKLEVNNKFSYGKHGYHELISLFKGIDIDIKKDEFMVYVTDGLFSGISQQTTFESEFNKFTNYRNIVIHENQFPNITGDDITATVNIFKEFVNRIYSELSKRLKEME